jgi:hypothetical protein
MNVPDNLGNALRRLGYAAVAEEPAPEASADDDRENEDEH